MTKKGGHYRFDVDGGAEAARVASRKRGTSEIADLVDEFHQVRRIPPSSDVMGGEILKSFFSSHAGEDSVEVVEFLKNEVDDPQHFRLPENF